MQEKEGNRINKEEKKENDTAQDQNEIKKRRLVRIETKRRYVYTVNNVFLESSVISRLMIAQRELSNCQENIPLT